MEINVLYNPDKYSTRPKENILNTQRPVATTAPHPSYVRKW
jgi:hypothetical protein